MGNPPFIGKTNQTAAQREDMALVFGAHRDAASAPTNSEHFRRLKPVMEELVHLETSAQVTL